MSDEDIATFAAITGNEDPQIATHYLEMANFDTSTAISLFFEHGIPAASNDATVAEQLQEESYQEEIRAPMAARHETLVDADIFPGVHGGIGGSFGVLNSRQGMYGSQPTGVFNQHYESDSDSDDVMELDSEGEEIRRPENHEQRLNKLFRPPFDIIDPISLDLAKIKGRNEKKWLLVDIQNTSIFQCQMLNRDLWSDGNVKQVVRQNFVFLQYQHDSPNGVSYLQFYDVDDFPYLAIMDPFTGERLKTWNDVPKPAEFVEELREFLAGFSLEPGKINPLVKHEKKVDPTKLSEEQQLELAIQQSLGNKKQVEVVNLDSDEDDQEPENAEEHEPDDAEEHEPENAGENSVWSSITPLDDPEPENKPGTTTRIQIRSSNGSRTIRRFNVDSPVLDVFRFVRSALVPQGEFTLTDHNRVNLISKLDESISDAGLKNAALVLEI